MTVGVFTVTGHKGATFTVNVTGATTFLEQGIGVTVFAKGTVTGTTVARRTSRSAKARHQEEHYHERRNPLLRRTA